MNKQNQQQKIYNDSRLKLKYEILTKLGEGCFGSIYKAINRSMKKQVALKFQFFKSDEQGCVKKSSLTNQVFILQKLKGIQGVPQINAAGKWTYGYFMEIQLLSSSLHDQRNKQFSQAEINAIAADLIQILRKIHSRNIVHQDLKPQNIMRNNQGRFIIIDYGLSMVLNFQNSNRKKRGFVGTPRYASLAAHSGQYQRPKDDIQSLLYVLASFYLKKAPWFELKAPIEKRLQKIYKIKKANSEQWFQQCGSSFSNAYEYVINLNSIQQLDYQYLINIFKSARKSYVIKTLKFEAPLEKQNRRKSTNDAQNQFIGVPTINLHLISSNSPKYDPNINIKSVNNSLFKCQQYEYISRSNNNFSQIAQDGYIQVLQMLTQKIFNTVEEFNINEENQDTQISSVTSKEPVIHNLSKLEGLHFKNPFEV